MLRHRERGQTTAASNIVPLAQRDRVRELNRSGPGDRNSLLVNRNDIPEGACRMARRKRNDPEQPATESTVPTKGRRGRKPKAKALPEVATPAEASVSLPDSGDTAPAKLPRRRGRKPKDLEAAGTTLPSEAPEAADALPADQLAATTELCDPGLATAEAALLQRYPDRRIKSGSLRAAGAIPGFGLKRTVVITCSACDTDRRVPTSDLFHVSLCKECKKKSKRTKPAQQNEETPTPEGGNP